MSVFNSSSWVSTISASSLLSSSHISPFVKSSISELVFNFFIDGHFHFSTKLRFPFLQNIFIIKECFSYIWNWSVGISSSALIFIHFSLASLNLFRQQIGFLFQVNKLHTLQSWAQNWPFQAYFPGVCFYFVFSLDLFQGYNTFNEYC